MRWESDCIGFCTEHLVLVFGILSLSFDYALFCSYSHAHTDQHSFSFTVQPRFPHKKYRPPTCFRSPRRSLPLYFVANLNTETPKFRSTHTHIDTFSFLCSCRLIITVVSQIWTNVQTSFPNQARRSEESRYETGPLAIHIQHRKDV